VSAKTVIEKLNAIKESFARNFGDIEQRLEINSLVDEAKKAAAQLLDTESVLNDLLDENPFQAVHFWRMGDDVVVPTSTQSISRLRGHMRTARGIAQHVKYLLDRQNKYPTLRQGIPDVVEGCIVEFRSTDPVEWLQQYKERIEQQARDRAKVKRQQQKLELAEIKKREIRDEEERRRNIRTAITNAATEPSIGALNTLFGNRIFGNR
jgi:hypothetical protein